MDIFIGNLPFSTTQEEVAQLLAEHGHVREVRVVADRDTGRSRGFAFATMTNDAEANRAIQALNGASLGGRSLRVNRAEGRGRPAGRRP